jgi:hypothetical protein
MNTELIYYRAWNETINVMYSPEYLLKNNWGLRSDGMMIVCDEKTGNMELGNVKPLLCSQKRDKNKSLVFQGDIVKYRGHIAQVEFGNGGFILDYGHMSLSVNLSDCALENHGEIIGDIYRNPDLLESKNDE